MLADRIHAFDVTESVMVEIQKTLSKSVVLAPLGKTPEVISGFDVSYGSTYAVAVLATFDKSMKLLEAVSHVAKPTFDYKRGFLSFRELPFLMEVWEKATIEPDVVVFDGNGVMHERRLGEASHASFLINKPTIGLGKSWHLGTYGEVGKKVGDYQLIFDNGVVVGAAVCTMKGTNPVFVSAGNGITLEESVNLILKYPSRNSKLCKMTDFADAHSRKLLAEQGLV